MRELTENIRTSEYGKNEILTDRNRIRAVYEAMASQLRGWDVRSAFAGGAASAIVYVTFLKYLSDRRTRLDIQASELYRFENIRNLYPDIVDQQEIGEYLGDVEKQLGFSERLLENFAADIKDSSVYSKFAEVLRLAEELDFKSNDRTAVEVEELIRIMEKLADEERKAAGISYTPSGIAQLMASICEIEDGMSVYDPCAGSGALLARAVRGRKTEVFAQERNSHIAAVMEMLLIMNGVREGVIRCEDSVLHPLTQSVKQKFDRVISEPPYMKPEYWYRTTIDKRLEGHILYYPELRIEDNWIFVRHIIASLVPDGRAVVLIPMSMLTREGAASSCRKYLVEDGYIDSVIELPAQAFSNRGIKTSILVLQKKKPIRNIYMLDLSRGLWEEKERQDEMKELADMIQTRKVIPGVSAVVKTEEIAEKRYQLAAARYVPQEIDVEQFVTDSQKLYETAEVMENKFAGLCKEFREAAEDYRGYCEQKKNRPKG